MYRKKKKDRCISQWCKLQNNCVDSRKKNHSYKTFMAKFHIGFYSREEFSS